MWADRLDVRSTFRQGGENCNGREEDRQIFLGQANPEGRGVWPASNGSSGRDSLVSRVR